MPYGTVKVDNVTFTNNLVDATTTFSGIYASITNNLTLSGTATAATFTGTTANFTNVNAQNISVTTSLSGLAITGGTAGFTTITGTTVTGTTANFVTISGTTVTGNTGQFTNLAGAAAGFTTVTGTTITGTTANFVSGVFTTRISGTTVTGTTASFTSGVFASLSGTTHTITSGVFASGTAALPSISFISDPNTGIYSPGADQVAVATNGTQRLTVDTAATTSTLPVVHPLGAVGTPSITFTGDLNTGIYSPAADTLALVTAGNNTLHITSGGLVGIGTSVPVYLFQAAGTIATVTTFGNFAALQTAGGTGFRWTLNNDNTFRLQHTLDGFTNATVPIHIDSSDRVGIGTTSPTAQLTSTSTIQVTGFANPTGGTGLELGYDGTNGIIQSFNRATSAYKDLLLSGNSIQLSIAGGEAARIDSSRRLLVGTSTTAAAATELLQVEGIAGNVAAGGAISLRRASVGNSDQIGIIHFKNATEGAAHASISAICDGTPAAGDFPGALLFSTTADGAASPTERVRVTPGGYLKASNDGTYFSSTGNYHELGNTNDVPAVILRTRNASQTDATLSISPVRAASSAYKMLLCYSGNEVDLEFNLRGDGNAYADGSWNGGGADYAECFEWFDSNPDAEDRRGISVVLYGDKIRKAIAGEDPIGVISGNPSVVGDAAWNKWNGKHLRDEFGSYLLDENGERQLNPSYDPDVEYISREERPEWDCVGLMGKLRIRKGQVTGSRWIKMRDISDSVEEWLVR